MKTRLLFLTLFFLLCRIASAESASLTWNANPEPGVAGYKLHSGTRSGAYTQSIDVGNVTTVTAGSLVEGTTYYFAVTAYSTTGLESGYSNEVSYTVPVPLPPLVLTLDAAAKKLTWTDPGAPAPPLLPHTYLVERAGPDGLWNWSATVSGLESPLPTGLHAGQYSFRVSVTGEPSTLSNVIQATMPAAPSGLRKATIQTSINLTDWTDWLVVEIPDDADRQFLRLAFAPSDL